MSPSFQSISSALQNFDECLTCENDSEIIEPTNLDRQVETDIKVLLDIDKKLFVFKKVFCLKLFKAERMWAEQWNLENGGGTAAEYYDFKQQILEKLSTEFLGSYNVDKLKTYLKM